MAAVTANQREALLDEVITAYLRAVDEGHAPDRAGWLAQHPDLAPDLERFFASQAAFARWAEPVRQFQQTTTGDTVPGGEASQPAVCLGAFGDYELLELIARGGMGVVFKARQLSVPRVVALKVIRAGGAASADDVRRFRNEVETAARLDHPNVVPVYDAGEQDGAVYFSMKLYEAGSLADRLDRFAADPRGTARLVAELARAVHHAHQRGVLHRDLKPSNVLLDDEGRPAVADFGLARRLDADGDLTRSGTLVGTPNYMAPELADGRKGVATVAADVYGLGAVLYALLTGRPPFRGETVLETLERVRSSEPEPPRRINARVDRDLETVCLKCLEKDPQKRYNSAAELADDLERWQRAEPVRARRASRRERARRWVRRNPALATLLAVVAFSFAGLVAGLLWHNERLRAEAEKTAQQRDKAEEEQRRAAQAVDDMYTRVAEDWLGPQPRLQSLQREFLEKALEYYQHAATRWADDPALRRKVPELQHRVGTIHAALGRHDRAEEALRQAVAGLEELAAATPDDAVLQRDLLGVLSRLGKTLQATGRFSEAAEVYRKSIDLAIRQAADFPDRPTFRSHPPTARGNLAYALAGAGRGQEAERLYREALAELDRLPPAVRDQADVRSLLANTQNHLGNLYISAGRFADAEPLYRQAVAGFERLKGESPANTDHRWSCAFTQSNLGATLNGLNRAAEARPVLTQAESAMGQLAADFPDLQDIPSQLAGVQVNLGVALRKLGEAAEAERFYRKAGGTLGALANRFPRVPEHRVRLGIVQANLGRLLEDTGRHADAERTHREAVATCEKLADEFPAVPAYRADLGERLFGLGNTLNRSGKSPAAAEAFTRALKLREKLFAAEPGNWNYRMAVASACNNLALVLAWNWGPPYPEAARALELGQRAASLDPGGGSRWRTLALAQFRVGNWRESLAAFDRASALKSDYAPDQFFRAMAHWHLGEKAEARRHHDAAARWYAGQANRHENTQRLRDEAAAVLGIPAEQKR